MDLRVFMSNDWWTFLLAACLADELIRYIPPFPLFGARSQPIIAPSIEETIRMIVSKTQSMKLSKKLTNLSILKYSSTLKICPMRFPEEKVKTRWNPFRRTPSSRKGWKLLHDMASRLCLIEYVIQVWEILRMFLDWDCDCQHMMVNKNAQRN